MKSKLCRFAKIFTKVICFFLIFIFLLNIVDRVLTPKYQERRWYNAESLYGFYNQPENSIEVLAAGPSACSASFDPMLMYKKYGIGAYNLACISQPVNGTLFWIKEALQYQQPKLVIVEVQASIRKTTKDVNKFRKSYDHMKWGINKFKFAIDSRKQRSNDVSIKEWLFPLQNFHDRWAEIDDYDLSFVFEKVISPTRGFNNMTGTFHQEYKGIDTSDTTTVREEYSEIDYNSLIEIMDLCEEKNIPLLLYRSPGADWSIEKHNLVLQAIGDRDITFIDFNDSKLMKELKINFAEDGNDKLHVNVKGAEKVSNYLADYIHNNYKNLSDFRTSEFAYVYNDLLDDYEAYIAQSKEELKARYNEKK